MDFIVTVGNKVKKRTKWSKYLELVSGKKKKKLWNMSVTVIHVVINTFGMILKGLERRLEELKIGRRIKNVSTKTF